MPFKKLTKKQKIISISLISLLIIVVTVFGILAYFYQTNSEVEDRVQEIVEEITGRQPEAIDLDITPDQVDIIALDRDQTGVRKSSKFVFTSQKEINTETVKQKLEISPAISFEVEEKSKTEYEIIPSNPLKDNQKYNFNLEIQDPKTKNLRTLSWSFATQDKFRIVKSYPADKSINVPTNTGIEIVFSHSGFVEPEKYISMEPQPKGYYKRANRTLSFVPEENLEPGTLYTVKVSKGIALEGSDSVTGEDVEFQFETDSDPTRVQKEAYGYFDRVFNEQKIGEKLALKFEPYSELSNNQYPIRVYQFNDFGSYVSYLNGFNQVPDWTYFTKQTSNYDISTINLVYEGQASLERASNGNSYLYNDIELEKGYYVVALGDQNSATIYTTLQVTNISTYLTGGEENNLLWVNNLDTQTTLAGGVLKTSDDQIVGNTNDQGLLEFQTPAEYKESRDFKYYVFSQNQETIAIPVTNTFTVYTSTDQIRHKYLSYLYTDREVYNSNDTINFWGLIKERDPYQSPQNLSISLVGTFVTNDRYQDVSLSTKELELDEFNTFTSSIELQNLPEGFYHLKIESDQKLILDRYIEINNYVKPEYSLSAKPTLKAYKKGQQIEVKGQASFYDQTPITDLDIQVTGDTEQTILSDKNGDFQFSYPTPVKDDYYYNPYSSSFLEIKPVNNEINQSDTSVNIVYYPYETEINFVESIQEDNQTVSLKLKQIDIERIQNGLTSDPYDYDTSPRNQVNIAVNIQKKITEKIENGSYYDPIQKLNIPKYTYNEKTIETTNQTIRTDSEGIANLELPEHDGYFLLNFELPDLDGSTIKYTRNVYSKKSEFLPNNSFLQLRAESELSWLAKSKVGQTNRVNLYYSSGEPVDLDENKNYLFYSTSPQIRDTLITQNPYIDLEFRASMLPNVIVYAVGFDGRSLSVAEPLNIVFDPSEKEIKIEVEKDSKEYSPGQKAKLKIKTQHPNGDYSKALVNISLVDEKVFAIKDQKVNFAGNLFTNLPNSINYVYYSTPRIDDDVKITGTGGGGGGGFRSDFKDTALFKTVQTDDSGEAIIEFDLPDDLTTYRITAQAVDKDLNIGQKIDTLTITQDFRVLPVISPIYLQGDNPTITLRSFGSNQITQWEIVSESLGIRSSEIATQPNQAGTINLGELPLGLHKVKISAKSGQLSDTIAKEFQVIPSYSKITETTSTKYDTEIPLKLPSTDFRLSVVPTAKAFIFEELLEMSWTESSRLENIIGQKMSSAYLNDKFSYPVAEPNNIDYRDYLLSNGSLTELPLGSQNIPLSTFVAVLDPIGNPKDSLLNYLTNIYYSPDVSTEERLMAMWALTENGVNTLNEAQNLIDNPEFSAKDDLLLALTLVAGGDQKPAWDIFNELDEEFSKTENNQTYLNFSDDLDIRLDSTSLMLILVQKLNQPEADNYKNFVFNNPSENQLHTLQKLIFIQEFLKNTQTENVSFQIVIDGDSKQIDLSPTDNYSVWVNADQTENIQISSVTGDITLVTSREKPANETENAQSYIKRNYASVFTPDSDIEVGDIVEVTLEYSLPFDIDNKCTEVRDYLPTGLKILTPSQYSYRTGNQDRITYPKKIDRQMVSFCLTKDTKNPIRYYARAVNPGAYWADSVIIQAPQKREQTIVTRPREVIIY